MDKFQEIQHLEQTFRIIWKSPPRLCYESRMSALAPLDSPRRPRPDSQWSLPPFLNGIITAAALGIIIPVMTLLRCVAIGLRIPGRQNVLKYSAKLACWCIGIRLHFTGEVAALKESHPRMLVANHASWLDIIMLCATAPAFYIASAGVRNWPLFGFMARIGETEFISQSRGVRAMLRERERIGDRLDSGDNLFIFPEGGRSGRLRPGTFHSAMLMDKTAKGTPVRITPVSICYVAARGLPLGQEGADVITMRQREGSMFLTIWRLLCLLPMDVVIEIHPTIEIDDTLGRREASDYCHRRCSEGVRRNCRAWAFYTTGDERALDETLPLKVRTAA